MYQWIYPNPAQIQNSINLIGQSIESERKDSQFYNWLIDNIPVENLSARQADKIRKTIESIRDDEIKHNRMYKRMYYQLTGKEINPPEEEFIPPESFRIGVEEAMMGELEAVRKYRKIMSGLPSDYYRDKVFAIITDELRHGSLYNYIYTNIVTGIED